MHRKTADKLLVAQNHLLFDAFLAVIFVRKSDRFRINFPDSLVTDRDFMRISAQIFHHRFWASKWLFGKNYPIFFPKTLSDFWIFFKVFNFQFLTKFSPENFTQCLYREQKFTITSDVFPSSVFIHATTRNNAVQMRMKTQILSPSVQNSNHSHLKIFVFAKRLKRFPSRFK